MGKFCEKCGATMAASDRFCEKCGAKVAPLPVPAPAAEPVRKPLTHATVSADLKSGKNPMGVFIGKIVFIALCIAFFAWSGHPIGIIGAAVTVIEMIFMAIKNGKLRSPRFYTLERPCLEKKQVPDDDGPDKYQLWFENMDGSKYVAIEVEKAFYDATLEGEGFYVIFLEKDKLPSLVYRQSEWIVK